MRANVKKVLQELGSDYCIKSVDWPATEDVYRDFNNGYDVEILVPYYSKKPAPSVYIWRDQVEIMARAEDVPLSQLKATLEGMYKKLGLASI